MTLVHIGVALSLSAAAAFLVTGAAMRPIRPDCAAAGHPAMSEPARLSSQTTGVVGIPGGSGLRFDPGPRDRADGSIGRSGGG